jgi:cytochrome c peroxidase
LRKTTPLAVLIALLLAAALLWELLPRGARAPEPASGDPSKGASLPVAAQADSEPLQPLPAPPQLSEEKLRLGRQLFHDPILSRDGSVSCASCHDLKRGGVDQLPRSRGILGAEGNINAPTVLNAGLNFRQFWDGRAPTLEAQVDGPIHNPVEMGSQWSEILPRLQVNPVYSTAFARLYPQGITPDSVRDAIASFERSLLTPSRFDRWLLGDTLALSPDEVAGYRLFKKHGCPACHQGRNVGGNLFQRFGVMRSPFRDEATLRKVDFGRYNLTGREEDKFVFKVPTLRNVELTPPYFHDGSAATLDEAVRTMGLAQLGVALPQEDVALIVKFLKSLTGEKQP